jgi:hypothetical protein
MPSHLSSPVFGMLTTYTHCIPVFGVLPDKDKETFLWPGKTMRKGKSPAGPEEDHIEKETRRNMQDADGGELLPDSDGGNSGDDRGAGRMRVDDDLRIPVNHSSRTYRGSDRPVHGGYYENRSGFRSPRRTDDHTRHVEYGSYRYGAPTGHGRRRSLSPEYSRGRV